MLLYAEDPDDIVYGDRKSFEDTAGIRASLRVLASIPSLSQESLSGEERKQAICLSEDIKRGNTIIYYRFNRHYPIARLLLRIARDSARLINEGRKEKCEVVLVGDEIHAVASAEILQHIVNMGRDIWFHLWACFQSYAQVILDGDRKVAQVFMSLCNVYFGTEDGAVTNDAFLKERTIEDITTHQGGGISYVTMPALRIEEVQELGGENAPNTFLIRGRGILSFGKALYPCSKEVYDELRNKGFPEVGDLPGLIEHPTTEIFRS